MTISIRSNIDGSGTILVNGSTKMTLDAAGNIAGTLTAARGDNTKRLSTTEFVRQNLGNYAGGHWFTSDATLTAAHVGKMLICSTGVTTVRLPAATDLFDGATYTLKNQSTAAVTVTAAVGSTLIITQEASSVVSITLNVGEAVTFTTSGISWIVGGQALTRMLPNFATFFTGDATPVGTVGDNGWCKLPNGMIFQWARKNFNRTVSNFIYADVTWPIPFPTRCVAPNAVYSGSSVAVSTTTPLLIDFPYRQTGCVVGTNTTTWAGARGDMTQQSLIVTGIGY